MSNQNFKNALAEQDTQPNEGSFVTGFTVGLFAGAAGFFLFGTDKGETVRSKIAAEWDNAKEQLAEEGVISSADVSIRDIFASIVSSVTDTSEEVSKQKKAPQKKTATSEKTPAKKKRRFFKST